MQTIQKSVKRGRLANYMEELADDVLKDLLAKDRGRFSQDAIVDIKALALNRLWPMYMTTTLGRDFIRKIVVEDKIEKDVIREVRAAIDIVKSNPRN
jgi:hypothetical protein